MTGRDPLGDPETGHPHRAAAGAFVRRVAERKVSGVEQLILFGSTVRGEASGLKSDVDFLAIVDNNADRSTAEDALRDIAYDVMLDHGPVVEVHVLSRTQFERRADEGHPFVRRALQEGTSHTHV